MRLGDEVRDVAPAVQQHEVPVVFVLASVSHSKTCALVCSGGEHRQGGSPSRVALTNRCLAHSCTGYFVLAVRCLVLHSHLVGSGAV
jgi:hypothetical protein